MSSHKILIIDDEIELAQLLEHVLMKEGFHDIQKAFNLAEGWRQFEQFQPDIVLLDIMLPDGEGYDLCKKIRQVSTIPVLFMSAKDDEVDKLLGLAIGGDDYITKPFSPKEVAYRVKAQLRRSGYTEGIVSKQMNTQVGPFLFNDNETELFKDGVAINLTAKEVGLMRVFLQHPNQILSKETLFEKVWGEDFYGSDNTVMVHIRRLREKIEDNPSTPNYLLTVKGLGYKFSTKVNS
ncbi:MAG: response regulator transcription factor [Kurthia sp.]|nr:response regulator transcription factor [Candidatus Kurthia equi]